MADQMDWEELLQKEDKLIENSDRKHRYHFKSLDNMSEELVYQKSVMKYQEYEPKAMESKDFIEAMKDERLARAMSQLTTKQRKAVELAYWKGYKGYEIAVILGCTPANVSILLDKALKKLQKGLGK